MNSFNSYSRRVCQFNRLLPTVSITAAHFPKSGSCWNMLDHVGSDEKNNLDPRPAARHSLCASLWTLKQILSHPKMQKQFEEIKCQDSEGQRVSHETKPLEHFVPQHWPIHLSLSWHRIFGLARHVSSCQYKNAGPSNIDIIHMLDIIHIIEINIYIYIDR